MPDTVSSMHPRPLSIAHHYLCCCGALSLLSSGTPCNACTFKQSRLDPCAASKETVDQTAVLNAEKNGTHLHVKRRTDYYYKPEAIITSGIWVKNTLPCAPTPNQIYLNKNHTIHTRSTENTSMQEIRSRTQCFLGAGLVLQNHVHVGSTDNAKPGPAEGAHNTEPGSAELSQEM